MGSRFKSEFGGKGKQELPMQLIRFFEPGSVKPAIQFYGALVISF